MATNLQVAERFASIIVPSLKTATIPLPLTRPIKGSNLKTYGDEYRSKILSSNTGNVFILLSRAESYSTRIAEIVYNTHAQLPELWIVHKKYSPTTQRHKAYLTQAFVSQMVSAGFTLTRAEAYDNIYYTEAMQSTDDCRVSQAWHDARIQIWSGEHTTPEHIKRTIKSIDDKGIHDGTRIARVHKGIYQANYLRDVTTKFASMNNYLKNSVDRVLDMLMVENIS